MSGKLCICGNIIDCQLDEKLSSHGKKFYHTCDQMFFGDFLIVHHQNFTIKEEINEALNTVTVSIGFFDYLNNVFYPLLEFCDAYQEEMDFGKIIWRP